jgi:hypothetical protein
MLGTIRMVISGTKGQTLRIDALAFEPLSSEGYGVLKLLSAVGPASSVKSFRAGLVGREQPNFVVRGTPACDLKGLLACYRRYKVQTCRLAQDNWHLVAVSQSDILLTNVSEESLWQTLRSERFTTPLLRGWVPWLQQRLLETGRLRALPGQNCQAGLLHLDTPALDRLVSEGIKQRALRFTNHPQG